MASDFPLQRAHQLYDLGRYSDAATEIHRVLARDPDDVDALTLLAYAEADAERLGEAEAAAAAAMQVAPDDVEAILAMAYIQMRFTKRLDRAEQLMTEAMRLDSSISRAWGRLAEIHIHQEEWAKALRAAQTGLELDPEDGDCLHWTAVALVELGRVPEALQCVDDIIARNPDSAHAHLLSGFVRLASDEGPEAEAAMREALRLDPRVETGESQLLHALCRRWSVYRAVDDYFDDDDSHPEIALFMAIAICAFAYLCVTALDPQDRGWGRAALAALLGGPALLAWFVHPVATVLVMIREPRPTPISKFEARAAWLVTLLLVGGYATAVVGIATSASTALIGGIMVMVCGVLHPLVRVKSQVPYIQPAILACAAVHATILTTLFCFAAEVEPGTLTMKWALGWALAVTVVSMFGIALIWIPLERLDDRRRSRRGSEAR